jgi:hypothetical protein
MRFGRAYAPAGRGRDKREEASMKKFIVAALAVCVAHPAMADHPYESIIFEYADHEGFSNRGQCESTIRHERNERRQHYDMPFEVSDPEYNEVIRTRIWCEEDNGTWYLVGV